MGSVVTAEEFYSSSLDFLFSIDQTQDEILDVLRNITSLSSNNIQPTDVNGSNNKKDISSMASSLNISSFVSSVNSIDKEKAIILMDLINTLDLEEPIISDISTKNIATIGELANSAITIVKNLSTIHPIIGLAESASDGISYLLMNLANGFSKIGEKSEDIEKSKESLKDMSIGILMFAGAIAGSVLLVGSTLDPVALAGLGITIGLFALEFQMIGQYGDQINDGAKSVALMALAIPAFALGMALAVPILIPERLLGIGLVIAGFGLEFSILGRQSKFIMEGALAVGVMALAIPLFAIGTTIASVAFGESGVMGLITIAGAIALFGMEFSILGSLWQPIGLGALVVGAMGLSLMMLADPLSELSKIFGTDKSKSMLWELPVLLTGIGSVYALAGIGSEFILLGAIAMGAVGLSLYSIGGGVGEIMGIKNLDMKTATAFSDVLGSILGSISNISMLDAISLPAKATLIGITGLSLSAIGNGIQTFKKYTEGFGEEDANRMSYVISKVSEAFATAGSTDGMSKLFGFNVGSNDIERGIESTLKMGKNLEQLSRGIGVWRDGRFTKEDVRLVAENVNNVMNVIPSVFASIGLRERLSSNQISIGGFKFSMPFTKTDTELGISSTMDMGKNLISLYNGVASWAKGGKNDITPKIGDIIENVTSILTTIPKIFAEVGKEAQEGSSLFGLIDGDMEDGVELVERMSSPLKSITSFLESFNNQKVDVKKSSKDISDMIGILGSSINILNPKKVDIFDDLVDSFENLTDVLKDYFKTMSKLPIKEFEIFDKHIQSLTVASTLKTKSIGNAMNSSMEIWKPTTPNIKEVSTVISQKNAPQTVEKTKDVKADAKKQSESSELNIALNQTLQQLISIMSQNIKTNNDILSYLKTGTFKTNNNPF